MAQPLVAMAETVAAAAAAAVVAVAEQSEHHDPPSSLELEGRFQDYWAAQQLVSVEALLLSVLECFRPK